MQCIQVAAVISILFSNWFLSELVGQEIINDHLSLIETKTKFNPNPGKYAPAGRLTITYKFQNISTNNLAELAFRVVKLTRKNLLLNADAGPGRIGSVLTAPFSGNYLDEVLAPGEIFEVDFVIGLTARKRFKFLVEELGVLLSDLEFIFPYSGQEVTGHNVLLWVSELGIPGGNLARKVIFETSLDGQNFKLLPMQEAPDLDVGSHTTALDTTVYPAGPLFLRARFEDKDNGPVIQVIVTSEEAFRTPRHDCGCEEMVVKTTGDSVIGDPRRPDDQGTPDPSDDIPKPAPLGIDPDFLSFNFEIVVTLTPGSNPIFCEEGQSVMATVKQDSEIAYIKKACTAGLRLAVCNTNTDCDTRTCHGGTQSGQACDTQVAAENCTNGGGTCEPNNDGVCTEFPFEGFARGNDDYRSPADIGLKEHRPSPTWFDAPGAPNAKRTDVHVDVLGNWDFIAFVKGNQGSCSCHFQLRIDWDGTNQVHRPGTGLTLIFDEDTFNCVQRSP